MGSSKRTEAIGFPPPLMGDRPLRLSVLAQTDDWLALDKPAGVAVRQHPWDGAVPDLDAGLNQQLEAGKPELRELGASLFGSVYYLDPSLSGVVLFGKSREAVGALRNEFGSGNLRFEFLLVAREAEAGGDERASDAPLLPHRVKPKMIPSTAKGKKCQTRFDRLADSSSGWSLWRAEADFFRPHQIRAHAALVGLSVMGDALYDGAEAPLLSALKPKARGPGLHKPVYHGPAVHLSRLSMPGGEGVCDAPPPKSFAVLLKWLRLDSEIPR